MLGLSNDVHITLKRLYVYAVISIQIDISFLFRVPLQEDCKSAAVSIDNDRSLRPSSIMLYSVVVGSDGHGNLADAMIV